MTNEDKNTLEAPAVSPEDQQYFKKVIEREKEAERKATEAKARQEARDEVWNAFKSNEENKPIMESGFDNFIKENPEFLDSPKLLSKGIILHRQELQLKQNSTGETEGETDDTGGSEEEPGNTGASTATKKYEPGTVEFAEAFGRGEISDEDIQKLDPKDRILLRQNRNLGTKQKTFFGGD